MAYNNRIHKLTHPTLGPISWHELKQHVIRTFEDERICHHCFVVKTKGNSKSCSSEICKDWLAKVKDYSICRKQAESRDGKYCTLCGLNGEFVQFEVDHIKPVSLDGTGDLENLRVLCLDCHKSETGKFLSSRRNFVASRPPDIPIDELRANGLSRNIERLNIEILDFSRVHKINPNPLPDKIASHEGLSREAKIVYKTLREEFDPMDFDAYEQIGMNVAELPEAANLTNEETAFGLSEIFEFGLISIHKMDDSRLFFTFSKHPLIYRDGDSPTKTIGDSLRKIHKMIADGTFRKYCEK